MERIRQLIADARAYVAAASPREKRLMALAAGGVLIFAVLIGTASFSAAIRRGQAVLDEKREDFEKISSLAGSYNREEQERQLLEAKLRQSPPGLMSFVDEIAKREGIDVGGMTDRGVVDQGRNGGPRESSVEVSLNKVPLEKLSRMLDAIEHGAGVVRVRRIRMRKNPENKDVLDVSLNVSAWQGA